MKKLIPVIFITFFFNGVLLSQWSSNNMINNQTVADGFKLGQNYPNPFNPTTNIEFSVPKNNLVTLKVYDITGKLISTLVNQNLSAGTYNVDFDASKLSSGVYFYKLISGNFIDVKKMIFLK